MSGSEALAADVPANGWNTPAEMRYTSSGSLRTRLLELALRYSATATSSGGRFVFETIAPSGFRTRDTLAIPMSLDIQQNKLREALTPATRIRLGEEGEWRFVVTPLQNTTGVWSIALDIK
jgi:hypothetical protein